VLCRPAAEFGRAAGSDPFRRGNNVLVLCDAYDPKGNAIPTNSRHHAAQVMDLAKDEHPWYAAQQTRSAGCC
jgi:glutamine synthetase